MNGSSTVDLAGRVVRRRVRLRWHRHCVNCFMAGVKWQTDWSI
jgi:hypothetical protein